MNGNLIQIQLYNLLNGGKIVSWEAIKKEMALKNGKALTQEQAALQAYCFNEAAKRKISPITLMTELLDSEKAKRNLGRIDINNGSPKKPSWQL